MATAETASLSELGLLVQIRAARERLDSVSA
jgi:hypothetical protein